jgi:hypothetical protein
MSRGDGRWLKGGWRRRRVIFKRRQRVLDPLSDVLVDVGADVDEQCRQGVALVDGADGS